MEHRDFWEAVRLLVSDRADAHIQNGFFGDTHILVVSGLRSEGETQEQLLERLHDAMLEEIDEMAEVV